MNECLGAEPPLSLPERWLGQCVSPLRELSADQVLALLHQAACVRLELKAAALHARARQAGWDQALWEGLFRALGYKQNVWPMQRLGELLPRWRGVDKNPESLQSRLLGIAGLLPAELPGRSLAADSYLRRVWDRWWRERDQFADCSLPRTLWRFANLRPANHPQRRLALAAHWLSENRLSAKLDRWLLADAADARLADSLLETLQVGPDEFWSWHWTLNAARLPRPQPLLGTSRATDLAVNVVLPWLWARARQGGDARLPERVAHRYFAWPAGEDNARLRQARQRLFGGGHRGLVRGAAAQQGLLQILSDFCDNANATCGACRFPHLVRDWRQAGLPA